MTQQKATARKGGLASYLKSIHADWNLVGRVTFHLAENKKHPEKPFAFMATFTPQEDKLAKTLTPAPVRHVPLSVALKQSIETQNTQMLDTLLEPVSRAAHSIPLIANLLETRTLFAPQAWGISRAYEFLSSVPELEKSGVVVRVPNWWNASRPPRPQVDVRVGTKRQSTLSNGGLDLQINVSIDGEPLSEAELAELANARQWMMFLRGKWVEVDQERLNRALDQWSELQSRHVDGLGFLDGMRMLAGASIDSQEMSEETRSWTRIVPGDWLKETLDQLRQPDGEIPIEAQNELQATLRPYQFEGVRWLWLASQLGLGVCLTDDMGLGKTIQVITLLLQFKHADRTSGKKLKTASPTLLILPTSLLENWQREIEKFAPGLKLQIWHRSMLDAKAMKSIAADPQKTLADVDVVATTYGLVRRKNCWPK